MKEVGEYLDEIFGENFTGWVVYFSWDGQIVDMDKNNLLLMTRLQTTEHKDGFLHSIRSPECV